MCFTSTASFAMAGVLIAGGAFCVHQAFRVNKKCLAMAAMPIVVGFQQFAEGLAWTGAEKGNPVLLDASAMAYMFFVWVFWPAWTPFMTAMLEPRIQKRRLLFRLSALGLICGLILYAPYLFYSDWLQAAVVKYSMTYKTTLLPDFIMPRWITCIIYLSLIGGPPLLSSYPAVRRFGFWLILFVPVTYFLYSFAYISVLCFAAAIVTIDLIFIIATDKCRKPNAYSS